jgi:hypothetical protein
VPAASVTGSHSEFLQPHHTQPGLPKSIAGLSGFPCLRLDGRVGWANRQRSLPKRAATSLPVATGTTLASSRMMASCFISSPRTRLPHTRWHCSHAALHVRTIEVSGTSTWLMFRTGVLQYAADASPRCCRTHWQGWVPPPESSSISISRPSHTTRRPACVHFRLSHFLSLDLCQLCFF